MTVTVVCPLCAAINHLPDSRREKLLTCVNCGTLFQLGVEDEPTPPPVLNSQDVAFGASSDSRHPPLQSSDASSDDQEAETGFNAMALSAIGVAFAIVLVLVYAIAVHKRQDVPVQSSGDKGNAGTERVGALLPGVLRGESEPVRLPSGRQTATARPADFPSDARNASAGTPRPQLAPAELFQKAAKSVVRITVFDASGASQIVGSGFFVRRDGMIVTCYHVIEGGTSARASWGKESGHTVEGVLAVDKVADLALLKVDVTDSDYLELSARNPVVGEKVFAIGNPQGLLTNTLSDGLISGMREFSGTLSLLQTTAPISPGSSGGPLLDDSGKVCGVVTGYFAGGQNLNFAVPSRRIRELLETQMHLLSIAHYSSASPRTVKDAESGNVSAAIPDDAWKDVSRGQYDQALRRLRIVPEKQHSSYSWTVMGYALLFMQQHDEAAKRFSNALLIDGRSVPAKRGLAIATAMNLNKYEDGMRIVDELLEVAPLDADLLNVKAICYSTMSIVPEYRVFANKAVDALSLSTSVEPDSFPAWFNLGVLHMNLRRPNDAVECFEKALACCGSGDDYGLIMKSELLGPKSVFHFSETKSLRVVTLYLLAHCKTELGRWDESDSYCNMALKEEPRHRWVLCVMAMNQRARSKNVDDVMARSLQERAGEGLSAKERGAVIFENLSPNFIAPFVIARNPFR